MTLIVSLFIYHIIVRIVTNNRVKINMQCLIKRMDLPVFYYRVNFI